MAELLQSVQESFERRYSSLLGLHSTRNAFSRNVVDLARPPVSQVLPADEPITYADSAATWVKSNRDAT